MARTTKATTKTTKKASAQKASTQTAGKAAAKKAAGKAAAPSVKGSKPTVKPQAEVVMRATHDDIARKAYEIWVAKGRPVGRDEENWREAEAAINSRQA